MSASLDEFTITLSDNDGRLSVETLKKTLEDALEMLRSIEAQTVASDIEVRWEVVRVQMRSPLKMTLAPHVLKHGKSSRPTARRLVKNVMRGVAGIESGTNVPRYFDDSALDATKKLLKTARDDGAVLSFDSPAYSNKVTLTEDAASHIDALSAKARLYVDYSTIEGRLEVVSVHERNTIVVWETLTKNRVDCFVSSETLPLAATFLGKRVAVSGRVHYRNHVPKSIHVEEPIRQLRETRELPQPNDIGPIDITDGLSSEEHVRRMRNA